MRRAAQQPYWLLIAFAALLLAPPAWAAAALIGAGAAGLLAGALRRLVARRGAPHQGPDGSATVLGRDADGRPLALSDLQLSAHGLILGASGAGKSTTLLAILTDHVRRGRPVVAIDLKGSPTFAAELASAAKAAGRPFRLWSPDGPGFWNPLAHGNATELKDKLILTERFSEPHYQRAAERYVQTVLRVLQDLHPGRAPTLDEVVRTMEPRRLATVLRGLAPERAQAVQDYLSGLTPDQLSAARGLATRLAIVSESDTGRYLSPAPGTGDVIDLRRALNGEEVVLFSLNSSRYGKLSAQLAGLVVQDLVAAVGHRLTARPGGGRDAPPAIVGIDEFSAIGADNVVALFARGREAGVSVLVATQELADLDRAAAGLRDQVLGNTAIKIAHRQDVPASAHTVAQMAGTVRRWEVTEQLGGAILGGYRTGRGTRRQVEQFRVHPDVIKTLGTGDAVVIVKTPRSSVDRIRVAPPRRERGLEL